MSTATKPKKRPTRKQNFFGSLLELPHPVWRKVFTFLSAKELCCASLVTAAWHDVASSDELWRMMLARLGFRPDGSVMTNVKALFAYAFLEHEFVVSKPSKSSNNMFHVAPESKQRPGNAADTGYHHFASTRAYHLQALGAPQVGKTCLFIRAASDDFPTEYMPPVFDEYLLRLEVPYGGSMMRSQLVLHDFNNSEEYHRLRPTHRPSIQVYLFVYSCMDRESLEALRGFHDQCLRAEVEAPIVLCGLQMDARNAVDLSDFSQLRLEQSDGRPLRAAAKAGKAAAAASAKQSEAKTAGDAKSSSGGDAKQQQSTQLPLAPYSVCFHEAAPPRVPLSEHRSLALARRVSRAEGAALAKELNAYAFCEVSARCSRQTRVHDVLRLCLEAAEHARRGAGKPKSKSTCSVQ